MMGQPGRGGRETPWVITALGEAGGPQKCHLPGSVQNNTSFDSHVFKLLHWSAGAEAARIWRPGWWGSHAAVARC